MLVALTTACSPRVLVHDQIVYGDLGPFGAHFSHTLTNVTGDVEKAKWDDMRVGMLCMDSADFTAEATTQAQLCNNFKVCDYQTQEVVMKVIHRVQKVALKAQAAKRRYRAMRPKRFEENP